MEPTWVLSALDGPHVGPMNLANWGNLPNDAHLLCTCVGGPKYDPGQSQHDMVLKADIRLLISESNKGSCIYFKVEDAVRLHIQTFWTFQSWMMESKTSTQQ